MYSVLKYHNKYVFAGFDVSIVSDGSSGQERHRKRKASIQRLRVEVPNL